MRVDILNPKAARLLKDLANLNLIVIKDTSKNGFTSVLKKLRSKRLQESSAGFALSPRIWTEMTQIRVVEVLSLSFLLLT